MTTPTGATPEAEVVGPDAPAVARALAPRLLTALARAQDARTTASVVLTGGGVGIALLAEVAAAPDRDAVDWGRVDVWWGDERYVPSDDAERNARQAREALLDALPLDPDRVHPVPASDGPYGADVDAAAAAYAQELAEAAAAAGLPGAVPAFDVLLLGVGPEGHTASLFPGTPHVRERARTVVGVRDCPKPPPTRVSLTLPGLCAAREAWVVVTGAAKAPAVARALDPSTDPVDLPAAGVRAVERTRWLLDAGAASLLGGARPGGAG